LTRLRDVEISMTIAMVCRCHALARGMNWLRNAPSKTALAKLPADRFASHRVSRSSPFRWPSCASCPRRFRRRSALPGVRFETNRDEIELQERFRIARQWLTCATGYRSDQTPIAATCCTITTPHRRVRRLPEVAEHAFDRLERIA
jgi:hypothetical protein